MDMGRSDRASRRVPCRRGRPDGLVSHGIRWGYPLRRLDMTSKVGRFVVFGSQGTPPRLWTLDASRTEFRDGIPGNRLGRGDRSGTGEVRHRGLTDVLGGLSFERPP